MLTGNRLCSLALVPRRSVPSSPLLSTFSNTTNPTTKSCVSLLRDCESSTSLKQLHARIFRLCLHENTDVTIKLVTFSTDPSRGDLGYGLRILNYARNPCLVMYNLMIKAFAKKGDFREVLLLFGDLRERGLDPDSFTYPYVLKAIARLGLVCEGEKVRGYLVKTGLEFDVYVHNSLMGMYVDIGRICVSEKLFDEMPDKDLVSWNVLISGYVKCGMFEKAVDTFRRMRLESDLKPDEATVVSTLSACTALKNLEVGEEVHRYISKEIELSIIMGNALVYMYCKCGCLNMARKIFDEMQTKNVICWTSMVSGYVNCGLIDEARELFDRSPAKDIILWTAMINGYVQFNRFEDAVELFREMQTHGIKPDKFLVVALLTGCAQTGALEQGKWIHGYIDENRITKDTVVGTALIEMYAKCGCIEKALEIFYGLRQRDTASWTSVICGLAMNGMTCKALELFSRMKQVGQRPDDITFIGVLSACGHGGLVEEGHRFFDLMTKTYHIQPKLEHYGCMIDLLGRAGLLEEAENLIRKIPHENNEVIVPLYGSLLSACRIHGNVKMGERMANELEKIESGDSSIHTLLANIYASADRWKDVKNVRRKMKDLGLRKVPGCSSIEIDGVVHEFLVGDPSHPELDAICSLLHTMRISMLGTVHETHAEKLLENSFCSLGFQADVY